MTKAILLVLPLTLICYFASGQEPQETVTRQSYNLGVGAAYFGKNLFYPGFRFSVEYPFWQSVKEKQKKKRTKVRYRTLFLDAGTGLYQHKDNHLGYLINTNFGYRKNAARTFKFEALLLCGYLHQFNAGETYQVTNGEVRQVKAAGRGYFTTGIGLGFGQDFLNQGKPFSWEIRNSVNLQVPYNTSVNMYFGLEIGMHYYLNLKQRS